MERRLPALIRLILRKGHVIWVRSKWIIYYYEILQCHMLQLAALKKSQMFLSGDGGDQLFDCSFATSKMIIRCQFQFLLLQVYVV